PPSCTASLHDALPILLLLRDLVLSRRLPRQPERVVVEPRIRIRGSAQVGHIDVRIGGLVVVVVGTVLLRTPPPMRAVEPEFVAADRKSTRLNSSHQII